MEKNTEKRKLVILTGPTASGKTSLSILLAKRIKGEIISADSMQVYRYMDIGTAKIREEEKQGIPHFLIDICEPKEEYNVVRFASEAKRLIKEINERGHIPIIAGGTGFYIQAVLYDIDFTETTEDSELRNQLTSYAKEFGKEALHNRLREVDSKAADAIHENNVKRVIRALEFYEQTGEKISEHNEIQSVKNTPYNSAYFVLNRNRPDLYNRINLRVDQMMSEGLVNEVKKLLSSGCTKDMVSMQGLGYKELVPFINGEMSFDEAVSELKQNTRHFAKRQLTWFRREKDVIWLSCDKKAEQELLSDIMNELNRRGIIDKEKDSNE